MKPSANKNPKSRGQNRRLARTLGPAAISEQISELKSHYPDAHCALNFTNAYELLVATILSAQCTDVRVNIVTPALFAAAPDAKTMATRPIPEIEGLIKSAGFYKTKAKNLVTMSRTLVERHDGKVPQNLEALIELPGVGRKTANVVLGNAFQIPSGVVVDTHVSRLSQRLGWTTQKTPEKIEKDLEKLIPKEDWILVPHLLISHGRTLCKARNPDCANCFFQKDCPFGKIIAKKVKRAED